MSDELFDDVIQSAGNIITSKSTSDVLIGEQRSDEWFEQRKGKFTGSKMKDLMAKGKGTEFGEKAKHYIFSRFMERLRGTPDTPIPSTWDMKRGQELEPYAIAAFERMFPQFIVEQANFMLFPLDDTAGASPDGLVKERETMKTVGIFETKARRDENTYSHAFERVNSKHNEFWQLQSEMEASGTNVAFYCHYSDLHEPPFDLQVQVVERSQSHVDELYARIELANDIIDAALEMVGDISELNPIVLTKRISAARDYIYAQ